MPTMQFGLLPVLWLKYGLDKRVGMLVVNMAGTKTRMIVIGILLGTAIPTAFVGEHAVAAMYVPIAMALYTLTNKSTPAPRLGTLLMITIAVGCMIGGPMSPTGGARNALMIGFLSNMGIDISFMEWVTMGVAYTIIMSVVMAFLLPLLPEKRSGKAWRYDRKTKTGCSHHGIGGIPLDHR